MIIKIYFSLLKIRNERIILIILFLTIIQSCLRAQENFMKPDALYSVDVSAEFPGGTNALLKYFKKHLHYPDVAAIKGKSGKVYIQFIVNEFGYIDIQSIEVIKGFNKLCDLEAVRILAENKTRWIPAIKNGVNVKQRFILPIEFKLDFNNVIQAHMKRLEDLNIKAVIVDKPGNPKIKDWQLYSDISLTQRNGYLSVGDTVEIIGWGPWLVGIKFGYRAGYLSWKSVKVTKELEDVMAFIEKESPIFEKDLQEYEKIKQRKDYRIQKDSINYNPKSVLKNNLSNFNNRSEAFFAAHTTKKNLYVGECAIINYSFFLKDYAKLSYSFYDLEGLVSRITENVSRTKAWIFLKPIEEIQGEHIKIDSNDYMMYNLFTASVCASKASTLLIDTVKLNMLVKESQVEIEKKIVPFTSKPLSIFVDPLPITDKSPTQSEYFSLTGKFKVTDSFSQMNLQTRTEYKYTVSVAGTGFVFPLSPPILKLPGVKFKFANTIYEDAIVNDEYQSEIKFEYIVVFEKPGDYNFSKLIKLTAFNPKLKKFEDFSVQSKFKVRENTSLSFQNERNIGFNKFDNFIAIDLSQSMMLEDYLPNRLGAVKNGVKNFLRNRRICDTGIITFTSKANQVSIQQKDSCYSLSLINALEFDEIMPGTSIVDPIFLAVNSFDKNDKEKKIIIICDGQSNAGNHSEKLIIDIAKKKNVKVHTIGVGNRGPVAFGKDSAGTANFIENTFDDRILKRISKSTGGSYQYAKNSDDITKSLIKILGVN